MAALVLMVAGSPAAAIAGVAGPSVFVCYRADQADPAVLPEAEAIRLGVRPYGESSVGQSGYWQPFAVDLRWVRPIEGNPLHGSTQLGGYYLQCSLPVGSQDTQMAVGGSGEIYDGATVAAYRSAPDGEALGIYEIFRAGSPAPVGMSTDCACAPRFQVGPRDLLPSGGRPLAGSIQLSGCTPRRAAPDPACTPGVALYYGTSLNVCTPGYPYGIAPINAAARLRIWASYGPTGRDGYAITRLVPAVTRRNGRRREISGRSNAPPGQRSRRRANSRTASTTWSVRAASVLLEPSDSSDETGKRSTAASSRAPQRSSAGTRSVCAALGFDRARHG